MGKQAKKQPKKVFQLLTTAQSNAYKEQVKKEGQTLNSEATIQLEKILQSNPDPNYLSIYSKGYDGLKQTHQLDQLEVNAYSYDQKAKRDRHFNMKKQKQTKESLNYPLTSNQEYGWREPIDSLSPSFGIKQTFDEKLIMTLKATKQPVIKK